MLLDKRVPFIYLFKQIKYDILSVFLMSVFTFSLKRIWGNQVPLIPITLPAFLGTAISLLLSFKLSQSYDRWWEARKIWGAIVNDSRSLVMQVMQFTNVHSANEEIRNIVHTISYRQIAWNYCLGRSLRNQDMMPALKRFVAQNDIEQIEQQTNKPLALLNLQARDVVTLLDENAINNYQQVQIDSTLVRLCDSMGKAERIRNTVFPVTYRQILRSFIYLFLFIMSLALLEIDSFWEIPLDVLISLPFFMIEKTARHMQDPFMNQPNDTAMTTIARTIEINIRQLWADKELPEKENTEDKFYVL
jgi:putative membrane protein